MRIVDESCLKRHRGAGPCTYCRAYCPQRAACHCFGKGAGRIDADWNLAAMALEPFGLCKCHHKQHNGQKPTMADLLVKVALRERTTVEAIRDAVYFIRRLDQRLSANRAWFALEELPLETAKLVRPTLERHYVRTSRA